MIKILASDGMEKSAVAALEAKGCHVDVQFYDPDALCEAVKDYDALIVRSATKVREPQIDAACMTGRLKIVIRAGVGIDNIDKVCAEGHGISVCNTPRASSNAVAELALAHMLSVARFISAAGHTMREGKWEKKAYEGIELSGKTVGIVGYGRIGQTLGKSCQALGMNVLAYDIYKVPELECETMRYVEMDELLAKSDFVSLHVPSLPGQPLINAETLAKMKNGVIIINTSRGTNVDEAALLDALNSGKVYGAGLDVFAEEPAKNAALYSHPRVSSTPHIGASTEEAQKRIGAEIVDILVKYFNL
ncbi:MAG TPA: D-2-hydroxyacid dehydrogenase [Candidatus Cryosericum sp.]|nr:D-2-hydroxyacid dehydrogenase [Candidatus Cryosericum sp.]